MVVQFSAYWSNLFYLLSSSQSVVYPSVHLRVGFTERITCHSVPLISEHRRMIAHIISLYPHQSHVFLVCFFFFLPFYFAFVLLAYLCSGELCASLHVATDTKLFK